MKSNAILFLLGFVSLMLTVCLVLLCDTRRSVQNTELRVERVESMVLSLQVDSAESAKRLDVLAAWKEVDELVDDLKVRP